MSKWTKRLLILVVLATILVIPSVYAYMFMHVETPDDTFITADIFIDDPIIEIPSGCVKAVLKENEY